MSDQPSAAAPEPTPEPAEIEREYGPFQGAPNVAGVSFDGRHVWFAGGEALLAIDPDSGAEVRRLDVACDAGTAFDGRYLYQLAGGKIRKLDPDSAAIVSELETPPPPGDDAGLTWAEGALWLARHKSRQIFKLDPDTGAVLRALQSDRFVTGVTFAGDELWHATWENAQSELRQIDADSGRVRRRIRMPPGTIISGLEFDGRDRFYCGGGSSGRVRALRKPKQKS